MPARASFKVRFKAYVLDIIFIILAVNALNWFLSRYFQFKSADMFTFIEGQLTQEQFISNMAGGFTGIFTGFNGLTPFVTLFYYGFELFFGVTLGKLIFGLKIADKEGSKASLQTLLLRYVVKNLGVFFSVLYFYTKKDALSVVAVIFSFGIFLGCFWVLSLGRQALHDLAADTAVFEKNLLIKKI